jgi:hypothetical protein
MILLKEKCCNLHGSASVRTIKCRRLWWAGQTVARERRDEYRILVEKTPKKKILHLEGRAGDEG